MSIQHTFPHGGVPAWTLGDRLRKAREAAHLNQSQLAEAVDTSLRSVGTYENDTTRPKRHIVAMWAWATGVDLNWLMTGQSDHGPETPGEQGKPPTNWYEGTAGQKGRRTDRVIRHLEAV